MELNGIGFTSLNTIFELCKEKYPNKEKSNKKVIKKQIQTDESAIYEDMLFVGKCIVLVNLFTEQIKCTFSKVLWPKQYSDFAHRLKRPK